MQTDFTSGAEEKPLGPIPAYPALHCRELAHVPGLSARRAARTISFPAEGFEHVRAERKAQEAVERDERREYGQEGAEALLGEAEDDGARGARELCRHVERGLHGSEEDACVSARQAVPQCHSK